MIMNNGLKTTANAGKNEENIKELAKLYTVINSPKSREIRNIVGNTRNSNGLNKKEFNTLTKIRRHITGLY